MAPLRSLLSTKNEFLWSNNHDQAFKTAKQLLTSAPTLSFYDSTRPTHLCTDASRQGLWFVVQQQQGDKWTLIQAGSRFLSDAESRYAIIELELLAVTWAILKSNIFLAGLPHFTILTDHHPLVPILSNHHLDEIENPRLQRLKMKIMGYTFTAEWIKGTFNSIPDALSRNPVSDPHPQELYAEGIASSAEVRALTCGLQHDSVRLSDLRQAAKTDEENQKIQHYIKAGFPQKRNQLPEQCRKYWNVHTQLSIDDGLTVFGCRLLIPAKLQHATLTNLHASHQGSDWTKQRARQVVYWPGIDHDIDNIILACKQCQDSLPSRPPEPMILKHRPARPFQLIAIDFCSFAGQQFLVIIDCCTDWPEVTSMGKNTTTQRLINALLGTFSRYRAQDVIWSDQGPQEIY